MRRFGKPSRHNKPPHHEPEPVSFEQLTKLATSTNSVWHVVRLATGHKPFIGLESSFDSKSGTVTIEMKHKGVGRSGYEIRKDENHLWHIRSYQKRPSPTAEQRNAIETNSVDVILAPNEPVIKEVKVTCPSIYGGETEVVLAVNSAVEGYLSADKAQGMQADFDTLLEMVTHIAI